MKTYELTFSQMRRAREKKERIQKFIVFFQKINPFYYMENKNIYINLLFFFLGLFLTVLTFVFLLK